MFFIFYQNLNQLTRKDCLPAIFVRTYFVVTQCVLPKTSE